ncbi:MAG: hypothetical protein ACOC1K_04280 [Nanoarchaeota archaeon]
MSESATIPQVNDKNTKAEILEAYSKAKSELDKLKDDTFDIQSMKKEMSQQELLSRVTDYMDTSKLSRIKEDIDLYLEQLLEHRTRTGIELKELEEAKEQKRIQLKELYDIEVTTDSMAAMVDAKKKLQLKLKEEEDQLKEVNIRMKEKLQGEYQQLEYELKQQYERLRSEEVQTFNENKRSKERDLEDELRQRKLDFENEIRDRERDLRSREELEAIIEDYDIEKLEEINEAVNKAVQETRRDLEYEYREQIKDKDRTIEYQDKTLSEKDSEIGRLRGMVSSLTDKLENSRKDLQELVSKVVEGSANKNMQAMMERVLDNMKGK